VLALLESKFGQRVPVYEVERAGHLQYAARAYSLRHVYGYVIVNGENGRTSEGRKRTWFALIGRLTRFQLATLQDLCRGKRMRYNFAIVQIFPDSARYLAPPTGDKPKLIRDYPTVPQQRPLAGIHSETSSLFPTSPETWRDPEEGRG
jgi:hypothetical protein